MPDPAVFTVLDLIMNAIMCMEYVAWVVMQVIKDLYAIKVNML